MNSRVLLIPAGALVLAGLGGCALSLGSGSQPSTARDRMYSILDDTEQALGGEWDDQDDPTGRSCVYPLWTAGTHFPALRVGPAPDDATRAIREISRMWKHLGYTLESTTVGTVTELKGTAGLDQLLVLRVSGDAMTLQGESECRPSA